MPEATMRWSGTRWDLRGDGGSSATLEWDVIDAADELEAIAAVPVTVGGLTPSTHPLTSRLVAQSISADRSIGFTVWLVRVEYGEVSEEDGGDGGDPLRRPAVVHVIPTVEGKPAERDLNGNKIVNAAGQPFSSPPSDAITTLEVKIVIWRRAFDAFEAISFMDHVNGRDTKIRGIGGFLRRGQVLCKLIAPEDPYVEKSTQPVQIGYHFSLKPGDDPHQLIVRNQGQMGFRDLDGVVVPGRITTEDASGNHVPVPHDVALDLTGKPLDPRFKVEGGAPMPNPFIVRGLTKWKGSTDDSIYLVWKIKEEADLGNLLRAL